MPAKKKPAAKKAGRKAGKFEVDRPELTPEYVEETISRAHERAESWSEAWRMDIMGVSSRVIAERLGVSRPTAVAWARNWERLVDGDPDRVSDRAWLVSRLDFMAEKMFGELTVLEAAEQRKADEAKKTEREYVKAPVWLANSDPLLKVLAQKARLVTPGDAGKKVTVEMAAQAGGLPDALGAVIARVTVEDTGDAA